MITITHRTGTYYNESGDMTIIEAHTEDGQLVSELYADPITGQIMNIETEEKFQGEGHARSLIQYAIDNNIELFHSPSWACTEEGAAFAAATPEIDTIADEDAYGWEDYAASIAA